MKEEKKKELVRKLQKQVKQEYQIGVEEFAELAQELARESIKQEETRELYTEVSPGLYKKSGNN